MPGHLIERIVAMRFMPVPILPSHVGSISGAVEAASTNKTEVEKNSSERRQPKTKRIQPRKRHVPGADHQRYEIVCKSEQDGHDHEENHGRAMHREHAVEDLWRHKVVVRVHQLDAHDDGFDSGDDQENQRVKDIENAQALVIDCRHPLMQSLDPWPVRSFRGLNGHYIR
jgi:hypothetical protein